MIAWISMLWANPLARKIITYAAVLLAIFLCLRWWGNSQWRKGEQQGRQFMARELEKQKQAEWKAKEAELEAGAAAVASEKRSVEAAAEQLSRDRAAIARSLKDALAARTAAERRDYANASAVPDSRIWYDIRAVSAELATDP